MFFLFDCDTFDYSKPTWVGSFVPTFVLGAWSSVYGPTPHRTEYICRDCPRARFFFLFSFFFFLYTKILKKVTWEVVGVRRTQEKRHFRIPWSPIIFICAQLNSINILNVSLFNTINVMSCIRIFSKDERKPKFCLGPEEVGRSRTHPIEHLPFWAIIQSFVWPL